EDANGLAGLRVEDVPVRRVGVARNRIDEAAVHDRGEAGQAALAGTGDMPDLHAVRRVEVKDVATPIRHVPAGTGQCRGTTDLNRRVLGRGCCSEPPPPGRLRVGPPPDV